MTAVHGGMTAARSLTLALLGSMLLAAAAATLPACGGEDGVVLDAPVDAGPHVEAGAQR